ncbi:MAG: hypothetical protein DI629_20160 [Mesorhizobium amorphae]|nr:MAG: hypothetical protein DI629_20160 [Mesorhizobium amorphae]
MTGERPSPVMIPSLISARSGYLARSTISSELSASRSFVASLVDGRPDPHRDEVSRTYPWMGSVRGDALARLSVMLATPQDGFGAFAAQALEAFRATSRESESLSDEEALRRIGGVRFDEATRRVNKGAQGLRWRDYRRIMMDLSHHDPEAAVRDWVRDGTAGPGLVRVILGALWLTGARPVELWSMTVMTPRTDAMIDAFRADIFRREPPMAVIAGLTETAEEAMSRTGLGPGRIMDASREATGAPSLLLIRSAKQTSANPHLKVPYRIQVLEGAPPGDAALIVLASALRLGPSDDADRKRLTAFAQAHMRRIASGYEDIPQGITLYTMRHSFANRLRSRMDDHEAAALTGHTARKTWMGYGARQPRRSGGWVPAPDPVRAEAIRSFWDDPASSLALERELRVPETGHAPPSAEPTPAETVRSGPDAPADAAPEDSVLDRYATPG